MCIYVKFCIAAQLIEKISDFVDVSLVTGVSYTKLHEDIDCSIDVQGCMAHDRS